MTVIGITGTREGANEQQLTELRQAIYNVWRNGGQKAVLHHGDCVGVDQQAHEIAEEYGIVIEVHPPNDPAHRAYTTGWEILHREKSYAARNQEIVDACDVLIAVPEKPESAAPRSGTWMTVRKARKAHKPVIILKGDRW